jgi:hypothetical protein
MSAWCGFHDQQAQGCHHHGKNHVQSPNQVNPSSDYSRTDDEHQFRANKREDRFNVCVARLLFYHYAPG